MRYTNVTSEIGSPLLHPHALQLVCLPRYTLGAPQLTQDVALGHTCRMGGMTDVSEHQGVIWGAAAPNCGLLAIDNSSSSQECRHGSV